MVNRSILNIAVALAFALAASAANAHAKLERATPAIGGAVPSPSEIRLKFSEGVEPRFSGVTLTASDGASVPLGQATTAGDPSVLVTPIAQPLAPGRYTVHWHAVSVDTHHTQGSFEFTVKP